MDKTLLAIRHFPDRKRPCIVLEQGNQCVVLGSLTGRHSEILLRKVFNLAPRTQLAIGTYCSKTIDELLNEVNKKSI